LKSSILCFIHVGAIVRFLPASPLSTSKDIAEVILIFGGTGLMFLLLLLIGSVLRARHKRNRIAPMVKAAQPDVEIDGLEDQEGDAEVERVMASKQHYPKKCEFLNMTAFILA
jgi:hypothetical protein